MSKLRYAFLLCVAVVVACATRNPTHGDAGIDSSVQPDGGDTLSPDERGGFDTGTPSVNAYIALVSITDRMFKFDPTIDTAKSAAQNAAAIDGQIKTELGGPNADGGAKCGNVSVGGSLDGGVNVSVVAAFGAAPGCKLGNSMVSGTITLDVGASGGTVSIGMSFANVTVDGTALGGSVSFSTTNGTKFTLVANLTYGTASFATTGFTVTGAPGSITLDGAITTGTSDLTKYTMTFTAVVWKQGDCYPTAGTLKIGKGLLAETIAFDAATATTGVVAVTIGKRTSSECLPKYGSCSPTCGKDGG